MSLGNKYLNNTILARYHDDTTDAVLSKTASNLLNTYEQQGYKIINTKDFYPNTIPESKYACYDTTSLENFLLYHDAFFQLAFEKYDDLHQIYKAIVRHFLVKVDGSVWVKQIIFAYPRSIFTLSDSDRAQYTKLLLALPSYNDFTTYYSSIYALRFTSPSLPIPCTFAIGSGCFVSELNYFLTRYNQESGFGNAPQVVNDRQDLINGFYYLAGEDLTSIAYPVSNNYIYSNRLFTKPYATGDAPFLHGNSMLHYVADNQTIKNSQTFWDTQTSVEYHEPPSVIQNPGGSGSVSIPPSGSTGLNPYQQPFTPSSYGDQPFQYGDPPVISGVGPEELGYYDGSTVSTGVINIYNMLCPPGFSQNGDFKNNDATIYPNYNDQSAYQNNGSSSSSSCSCSNSSNSNIVG